MSGARIGSLFSGIDGLALGVQMVTCARVAWHAETDRAAGRGGGVSRATRPAGGRMKSTDAIASNERELARIRRVLAERRLEGIPTATLEKAALVIEDLLASQRAQAGVKGQGRLI